MSSTDIADVNKFFKEYGISFGSNAPYQASAQYTSNSVSWRLNYAIAASVVRPTVGVVPLATVYWTTLLDVLFYRGLQDLA